jgi:hypothetical protein
MHQGFQRRTFHDEIIHTGLEGFLLSCLATMHRQGDQTTGRSVGLNLSCGLIAVQIRHFQVHEDHIRLESSGLLDGFPPISSLADNLEVASQRQQGAQVLSHSFHIVHDHYPDVSHAINICAEEPDRIRLKVEPALQTEADFSGPTRDVGLHREA